MSSYLLLLLAVVVVTTIGSIYTQLYINRWYEHKEDIPEYAEALLENSTAISFNTKQTDCVVLKSDNIQLADNQFIYLDNGYVITTSVNTYSNPGKVTEVYKHPVLMEAEGLDIPEDFVSSCIAPVKTTNTVTFADGTQYDVEIWSYLIDYNSVRDDYPTVVLPVATVVAHTTGQERYVFNFTVLKDDSKWRASDLVQLANPNSSEITLYDLEDDLLSAHEILLSNVIGFFQHVMFKEPIQNATL